MTDSERVFTLLRRVRRQKDVIVRLGKLPERVCGECIVVITLDPKNCKEANWPLEEVLVHELLHGTNFMLSENAVRRRTNAIMKALPSGMLAKLTRFVKKLTY